MNHGYQPTVPSLIYHLQLRSVMNRIQSHSWRRWVEISVSVIILIAVIWGGYLLTLKGFSFLWNQGQIGQILLKRIFTMGWSVVFYLLIISNIITAFSTFYRSDDILFLLSTHLSYRQLFRLKFVNNLVYSSWAVMIIGVPMTAAYGSIQGLNALELTLTMILGLIPLLIIACAGAMIILLPLIRFSTYIRLRSSFIILFLLFIGAVFLYRHYNQADIIVAGDLPSTRYLSRYLTNLGRIPFAFNPAFWLTETLNVMQNQARIPVWLFWGLLYTTALVSWEFVSWLAGRFYYATCQIQMTVHRIQTATNRNAPSRLSRLRLFHPDTRGLLIKDLLQFIRTPQQWIQFLLYLGLIMIYLINLSRVQYAVQAYGDFWTRLVYILNFGFSGFILASLITRFIFPLISLEGKNRWILLSAPVKIQTIFRQKFWLASLLFFLIAEAVAITSNWLLDQGRVAFILSSVFLMLMSLTLTSISLGLGALFPRYNETNPMRIVSGLGGIIAIVISLVYLGIMVLSLIWLQSLWTQSELNSLFWGIVIFTIIMNAIAGIIPLRLGYRALARSME